jgi:hypothetical protein
VISFVRAILGPFTGVTGMIAVVVADLARTRSWE